MPLGWFGFGMGVEETRGKHVLLSQEASVQGLSEVFQRLKLPQKPVHLGWCSQSAGSEDILDVSKKANVGKCHRHLGNSQFTLAAKMCQALGKNLNFGGNWEVIKTGSPGWPSQRCVVTRRSLHMTKNHQISEDGVGMG